MNVFDRAAKTNMGIRYSSHTSPYAFIYALVCCQTAYMCFSIHNGMNEKKKDTNWQREDFIPLWVEALIDCVGQQSVVPQFQHTEGITLACRTQQKQTFTLGSVWPLWQHKEQNWNPNDVPFKSAASRSAALITLTCRKPTSLRLFKDLFRLCGDSEQTGKLN